MLAEAGVTDPLELAWLDPPPVAAYAQARELLVQVGALDEHGAITPHGRTVATLPMHPRLAHMILAAPPDLSGLACDLAALLGERDVLRRDGGAPDADLRLRLEVVRASGREPVETVQGMTVDRDAIRRVREQSGEWRQRLRGREPGRSRGNAASHTNAPQKIEHAGLLLALAYPDRIGQRRSVDTGARFLLRNGRGAVFPSPQPLGAEPYIVVADLDDQRPDGRIFLAAPLALDEIALRFGPDVLTEETIEWDSTARSVIARRRARLGALIIADAPLRNPDPTRIAAALLDGVRALGMNALAWSDDARRLRDRMAFAARHDPAWPAVSDDALASTLDDWLAPHLTGLRRLEDVQRLDLAELLRGRLNWKQRAALDDFAPSHLTVPSGSRIAIDYSDTEAPVLAVRLQEMFGCTETPSVGGGRVPLTIQLLSPAHRPVQVTRDLAGFWRTTYFDVRKDLRGRYPKHHWPDDPLAAAPTNRAKRRP